MFQDEQDERVDGKRGVGAFGESRMGDAQKLHGGIEVMGARAASRRLKCWRPPCKCRFRGNRPAAAQVSRGKCCAVRWLCLCCCFSVNTLAVSRCAT